jgi:pyrroline-5-carboxylate reductase
MLSKVASPGGTTIEGIQALEDGGLTSVVMDAVTKAAARASELEG